MQSTLRRVTRDARELNVGHRQRASFALEVQGTYLPQYFFFSFGDGVVVGGSGGGGEAT